jgi:prephenate dehydrogenase
MPSVYNSIAIIGFGKFGRLAYSILKKNLDSKVRLAVHTQETVNDASGVEFVSFDQLSAFDALVIAIPIGQIEGLFKNLAEKFLNSSKAVIDVCSVKIYPKSKMLELLPESWELIGLHPLFGPASYRANNNSLLGFTATIEKVRASDHNFESTKKFLDQLGLGVLEMTAEDHDKFFGEPQFLTHLAAALFKGTLDSGGAIFEGLKSVDLFRASLKLLTSDEALLQDMFKYNPYAAKALEAIDQNWARIKSKLS